MSTLPIVAAVYLRRNRKVYLSQRSERAASLPGHWQNVGGKAEPGEAARDAARRETLEEAGLAIELRRFRQIGSSPCVGSAGQKYRVVTFLVDLKPNETPIPAEDKAGPWVPVSVSLLKTLAPAVPGLLRACAKLSE